MTRYLVDANVVLRFLLRDHADHARAATSLFSKAEGGDVELIIAPWTVAEIVYALTRIYGLARAETGKLMKAILSAVGITAIEKQLVVDAIDRFVAKNVDFADALLAAQAKAMGIQPASFDRDLDKFADVKRYEP